MSTDSVVLSPATMAGFNTIGIGDFNIVETPERMAGVVLILKKLGDTSERFPRGKWATIQEIERQLDGWALVRATEADRP